MRQAEAGCNPPQIYYLGRSGLAACLKRPSGAQALALCLPREHLKVAPVSSCSRRSWKFETRGGEACFLSFYKNTFILQLYLPRMSFRPGCPYTHTHTPKCFSLNKYILFNIRNYTFPCAHFYTWWQPHSASWAWTSACSPTGALLHTYTQKVLHCNVPSLSKTS